MKDALNVMFAACLIGVGLYVVGELQHTNWDALSASLNAVLHPQTP